jgi:D-alanine-D-alanine ligase
MEQKPDLVFNLCEEFVGDRHGDCDMPGLLDLMGIPHTGGGAHEMGIQTNKDVAKKIMRYDGLPTPNWAVFPISGQSHASGALNFPLFVKPAAGAASEGIDENSYCTTRAELVAKAKSIHSKLKVAALAEEFIDGREFYVGIIGNENPKPMPVVEMIFNMPAGTPPAMTAKAKFGKGTAEYQATKPEIAKLDPAIEKRIQSLAVDAYRSLKVVDYGRIDLRMAADGRVYVIDVNGSAYLEAGGEFMMAAKAAGVDQVAAVKQIVSLAAKRQSSGTASNSV